MDVGVDEPRHDDAPAGVDMGCALCLQRGVLDRPDPAFLDQDRGMLAIAALGEIEQLRLSERRLELRGGDPAAWARLSIERDPSVAEQFDNGMALCGRTLRPVGDARLTGREPTRSYRNVHPRGQVGQRRAAARLEFAVEHVEGLEVDEVTDLVELIPDHPAPGTDVRSYPFGDPGESADAPAALPRVGLHAQRERDSGKPGVLLDREILIIDLTDGKGRGGGSQGDGI